LFHVRPALPVSNLFDDQAVVVAFSTLWTPTSLMMMLFGFPSGLLRLLFKVERNVSDI
jgi:hypothetical protein